MIDGVENIPKLRFPGFYTFWNNDTLKNLSEVTSSKRIYAKDYVKSGIPFFRGKEISEGIFKETKDLYYISEKTYADIKNKFGVPSKGDLLITSVGTLGNVAIVPNDFTFYFKDGNLIWLRNILLNSLFLNYYLISEIGKNKLLSNANGSNQKALTINGLEKLSIYFPSFSEQEKIGGFFSKLDRQIELEEEKLELLEQQKRGYMQKIFSQELRFKDENGNDYPDWEETTLKNITNYISSKKSSNQYNKSNNSEGYPVYDAIQEIGKDLQYDMKEPYISILKDGAGVGRLSLRAGKSSVIGTMGYIQANNVDIQFLYYRMKLLNFRKFIIGSTIPHLYYKDYSKEKILIPTSNDEQKKIGHFILNIDKLIANKTLKLDYLKQRKQGLLQRMFI